MQESPKASKKENGGGGGSPSFKRRTPSDEVQRKPKPNLLKVGSKDADAAGASSSSANKLVAPKEEPPDKVDKYKSEPDQSPKEEPSETMSSADNLAALSEYLQASQMSSAINAASSQLAMAQLLNLPGLNPTQAALMASAAGKPLANMLSMAMLQQQQQQREQQAQAVMASVIASAATSLTTAASLTVTPPRRGRGSRGGSLGRPRGSSLANKLKKLDS